MKNEKKLNLNSFSSLPIKQQQDILSGIAAKANQDQLDLVERYDKKFSKTKTAKRG